MVDKEKLGKVLQIVTSNDENLQPFVTLINELIDETKDKEPELHNALITLRDAVRKYLDLSSKHSDEAKNQWEIAVKLARNINVPYLENSPESNP